MISLTLNHQNITAKPEQTILEVAKAQGINIPTLCHFARGTGKESPRAVCRICVVEITGVRGLVTACSAKVTDGMEVLTHSPNVVEARKVLMEFMLAENGGGKEDTVVKALSEELGVESARFSIVDEIEAQPQKLLSEYFNVDPSLCVHCDRCIVACESRQVITRSGFGHEISTTFGDEKGIEASNCNYCGDCISACPAGGITKA